MLTFSYRTLEVSLIVALCALPFYDTLTVACISLMMCIALGVVAVLRGLGDDRYAMFGALVSIIGGVVWLMELMQQLPLWVLGLPLAIIAIEYLVRVKMQKYEAMEILPGQYVGPVRKPATAYSA